jgi:hypothetical protein
MLVARRSLPIVDVETHCHAVRMVRDSKAGGEP